VGVEEAPIEQGATGEQSVAGTREEIEKLQHEDAAICRGARAPGCGREGAWANAFTFAS